MDDESVFRELGGLGACNTTEVELLLEVMTADSEVSECDIDFGLCGPSCASIGGASSCSYCRASSFCFAGERS